MACLQNDPSPTAMVPKTFQSETKTQAILLSKLCKTVPKHLANLTLLGNRNGN